MFEIEAKKRILIDARCIFKNLSGVGIYTLEMIRCLLRNGKWDLELLSACPDVLRDLLGDNEVIIHKAPSHESHPVSEIWLNTMLPRLIKRRGVDLYWGPAFLIPWVKVNCPTVVTVHDLTVFDYPGEYRRRFGWLIKNYIRFGVAAASCVATVSESVKRKLQEMFGRQVVVQCVPCGVDEKYYCEPTGAANVSGKYLLMIGGGSARKNVGAVIQLFRDGLIKDKDVKLVIVGGGRSEADGERVIRLPWLPHNELAGLYRKAALMAFPSLDEGFGIPIIEAFQCGCPVVLSDIPVFHEVAGDCGFYFRPGDSESLNHVIDRVLSLNEDELECLRGRMYETASQYTWNGSAEKLSRVFEVTLEKRSTHGR